MSFWDIENAPQSPDQMPMDIGNGDEYYQPSSAQMSEDEMSDDEMSDDSIDYDETHADFMEIHTTNTMDVTQEQIKQMIDNLKWMSMNEQHIIQMES